MRVSAYIIDEHQFLRIEFCIKNDYDDENKRKTAIAAATATNTQFTNTLNLFSSLLSFSQIRTKIMPIIWNTKCVQITHS